MDGVREGWKKEISPPSLPLSDSGEYLWRRHPRGLGASVAFGGGGGAAAAAMSWPLSSQAGTLPRPFSVGGWVVKSSSPLLFYKEHTHTSSRLFNLENKINSRGEWVKKKKKKKRERVRVGERRVFKASRRLSIRPCSTRTGSPFTSAIIINTTRSPPPPPPPPPLIL